MIEYTLKIFLEKYKTILDMFNMNADQMMSMTISMRYYHIRWDDHGPQKIRTVRITKFLKRNGQSSPVKCTKPRLQALQIKPVETKHSGNIYK